MIHFPYNDEKTYTIIQLIHNDKKLRNYHYQKLKNSELYLHLGKWSWRKKNTYFEKKTLVLKRWFKKKKWKKKYFWVTTSKLTGVWILKFESFLFSSSNKRNPRYLSEKSFIRDYFWRNRPYQVSFKSVALFFRDQLKTLFEWNEFSRLIVPEIRIIFILISAIYVNDSWQFFGFSMERYGTMEL